MAIDAQRLRTQCIYESRGPLASLLADLGELDRILEASQAQRRTYRWWSLYCLIGCVAAFIASLVLDSPVVLLVALAALAAAIGLFIYSFVYSNKLVRHRNRHDLLKQLMAHIQKDAHAKAPFSVLLSLASAPQMLSEQPWPVRRNGKQQLFREQWLSIQGPLLDGTTVSEDVTELSRKRKYTNPRGKSKTKTRSRYLMTMRFSYPPELYGDARPAQLALHEDVRVPASAKVRAVRVSEKAVAMKARVELEKDIAQTAAMMSMGTYRILNLARRAAASQRGSAR